MSDVLVSVIICVRNGEKYLPEALDSVANQAIDDLQVIVVDDGSTDDTARVAESHTLAPQILSQEPLGFGVAFNRALRAAGGQYLAFLDCDDVWPRGRLKAMLAALAQADEADFVIGHLANTDASLNRIGAPLPSRLAGAMLIKRISALKIGELRTDIAHGAFVDWCSRAASMGLKFVVVDEIVLLRRIHGENIGASDRIRARSDLLRVVRDHLKRSQR